MDDFIVESLSENDISGKFKTYFSSIVSHCNSFGPFNVSKKEKKIFQFIIKFLKLDLILKIANTVQSKELENKFSNHLNFLNRKTIRISSFEHKV
jgi:hypothetical protein